MKNFLRLLLASALLAPAVLSAASFEGKVSFKMTSGKGQPQEITYNIKGDKMRIQIPGQPGGGGMIMDTTKKEMLMMMDEQKMYMTMSLEGTMNSVEKKAEAANLEKTSETEKILGYTATKYILTDNKTETELWLAEGLGTFMGFSNRNPMARGRGPAAPAWETALAGKDLFPLRVVGRDKANSEKGGKGKGDEKGKGKGKDAGGNENFRMEATAIDKMSLPDSLFTPPADYQKFDMGGMMKGIFQGVGR